MTTLAMDESGNTQQIIAVALASIPKKEIPKINSIFTLSAADPPEIQTLYNKKSLGEFKYTDLREAFRKTQLEVYDVFLKQKLKEICSLKIQVYLSVFPNAETNDERQKRFLREAQDLLHKWAHQNKDEAFSKDLEILADQQLFPEKYVFEYYRRRGRDSSELIPKKAIEDGKTRRVYTDRENTVEIQDANSKTMKSIQLTDFLVGCAREHYALKVNDYFRIISPLFKKEHMRVQLTDYKVSERGFLNEKKLREW